MIERIKLPSRSLNHISLNTARILEGVQRQLNPITSNIEPDAIPMDEQIPLKEALKSGNFQSQGMGLYKGSYKNEDYGKIWVRKSILNEKTGEKEDWLVAYEDDDGNLIRQVAMEKIASLEKTTAPVKPENIPIAEGVKSKNLTMDQSGGSGTAKVTFEFTDVNKGLKFYQEQFSGGGEKEEGSDSGEETNPTENEKAPQVPTPQPSQNPPLPQVQPKASNLKTADIGDSTKQSLDNYYKDDYQDEESNNIVQDAFGQQLYEGCKVRNDAGLRGEITKIVGDSAYVMWDNDRPGTLNIPVPANTLTKWASSTITEFSDGVRGVKVIRYSTYNDSLSQNPWELALIRALGSKEEEKEVKYSFINEKGIEIPLSLRKGIKVGEIFERSDNHDLVRFTGFIDKVADFGDTHEGEGNIECSICKEKFNDIQEARHHVKDVHGYNNPDYFLFGISTTDKTSSLKTANEEASIDIHIEAEPSEIENIIDTIVDGLGIEEGEDKIHGGKGDNVSDEEFDEDELEKGKEHEKEHTNDEDIAKEIAKDHEVEDPEYYEKLDKMEKKDKKESSLKLSFDDNNPINDMNWTETGDTNDIRNEGSYGPFNSLSEIRNRMSEIVDLSDLGEGLSVSDLEELVFNPDEYELSPSEIQNVHLKLDTMESFSSKTAADISDEVPPASWKTDESKSDKPDNNVQPLPPKDTLNNQPGDVLYDSNQGKGTGKFQVTTDPSEKTVTVKFLDQEKEQALDNALNQGVGNPPQPSPLQNQQQPSPSSLPATNQGEEKKFEDTNSQVTF